MKLIRILSLGVWFLWSLPVFAEDVRELMDRVNNRYVGKDYVGKLALTQTAKSGRIKAYVLDTQSLKEQDGRKSLLKFVEPGFMRGSGILLHGQDHGDNLQWLYLSKASRSQPRRIAAAEKGQPLFGTDIAYIDIEDKKTDDFEYVLLPSEEEGSIVVEAKPRTTDYPYSKTISRINTKTWIEETIEYYHNGALIKLYEAQNIEVIDDVPTVTRALVKQLKTGSTTEIQLMDLGYNTGLHSGNFTLNDLTSKR